MGAERSLSLASAAVALLVLTSAIGHAHEAEESRTVFERAIPNIKGKRLVARLVTYGPGAETPSHRHARSAFIYAHVLSGAIRSQVDDGPVRIYRAGEGFHEEPGSHHRVSQNASDHEPASLLAVFIVDSDDNPLVLPDRK